MSERIGVQNGRLQARVVEVTLGQEGQEGFVYRGSAHGFHIEAQVQYSLDAPPKASITLYNISDAAVGALFGPRPIVTLAAGYGAPTTLFVGSPVRAGVKVTRNGGTRTVEIEAQTSHQYMTAKPARFTFEGSTTYNQVAAGVAESIGLQLGVSHIPDSLVFPNGFTFVGDAVAAFQRIAQSSLTYWTIEEGKVFFLYRDQSREEGSEGRIIFSSKTGNLIGTPEWKDDGVAIKGLLDPTVRPGMAFKFESLSPVTGQFTSTTQVARDVSFAVSSRGPEFYVSLSSGQKKGTGGRPSTYDRGGPK